MLHDPGSFISKQHLFSKKDRLLIAFSGGSDSVVLAHLLHSAGYSVSLAHCNFGLRGKESDGDETFCRSFAKKNGLDFFSKNFDTTTFAKENELSIQMAARQLRYDWFAELLKDKSFDYILTAHHANDNIETLLINLVRGTGIHGLSGIPQQQQSIVRPLLHATKEEILLYIKKHKLKFRDDSSNDEVKYKRNFLRHEVLPKLKQLNPSLEATFEQNIKLFNQAGAIVKQFVNKKQEELVLKRNGQTTIDLKKLLKESHKDLLLHEFLSPFGFNPAQTGDMLKSAATKQPGKLFFSPAFQALIDRSHIIVSPVQQQQETEYIINSFKDLEQLPIRISCSLSKGREFPDDKNSALLDADQLPFPWTIRKWRSGDRFRPLGMSGFKKLSDFFISQKLNRFEKEQQWLLLCGADIAWVIGRRIDDRYKITGSTQKIVELKLLP